LEVEAELTAAVTRYAHAYQSNNGIGSENVAFHIRYKKKLRKSLVREE
jgi:hypothetical protein